MGATGVLAGIASRTGPRAPMVPAESGRLSLDLGLVGDWRGVVRAGKTRRQISLIEAADWQAAVAELAARPDADPAALAALAGAWQLRRANLLVEGLDLPQRPGAVIRIGRTARVQITVECDPCTRMDEIAPGLQAALRPDWRGGALARVVDEGDIRVGDPIIIEE
jgi:MOSC domain-containing protein YiiM